MLGLAQERGDLLELNGLEWLFTLWNMSVMVMDSNALKYELVGGRWDCHYLGVVRVCIDMSMQIETKKYIQWMSIVDRIDMQCYYIGEESTDTLTEVIMMSCRMDSIDLRWWLKRIILMIAHSIIGGDRRLDHWWGSRLVDILPICFLPRWLCEMPRW